MAKTILLPAVLLVAFLGSSLSFVGLRAAPRQESRTALRGQAGASATPWTPVLTRDVVEIEFTAPAQGARCRFMIKSDADASEVLSEGRKRLGFNQEWMPDSDFKIYNSEDEEAGPLKGKMKDNGLIDFTYEASLWFESWELLSQMLRVQLTPNVITCNTVINLCAKEERWQHALSLLTAMPKFQVCPDKFSYASTIGAVGPAWLVAIALLQDMCDDDIPPDDVSYTSAISACAKGGCWHVAMQLLSEMSEARFNSDLFAYNAVIRACKAGGLWPLALGLLDAMPPAALAPDVISYSSVASVSGDGGRWELAPQLLHRMAGGGVASNVISLSAGIRALDRGGAWDKALDLFWSMPRRKVPPSLFSYSSAVNACGTSLEWQTALCVMESSPPGRVSFGAAVAACAGAAAWAPAMSLLRGMASAELTPGAVEVGTAAFAVRSACGRDAAIHFLRDMATLWRLRCRGERSLEVRLDRSHPGEILKTGEGLLAASKPDGISTESFVAELALRLTGRCDGLFPASRLDFPTSGVLPVALGNVESLSARWLQAQLAGRLVQKEYLCLCEGSSLGPADTEGAVDVPLLTLEVDGLTSRSEVNSELGREARTEYKVLGRFQAPHPSDQADDRELMLLSAHPITGRTHQIRVHMAHLGRPLIGDRTYGRRKDSLLQCPRLFLHCSRIRYLDLKEADFSAHAPLPAALADALAPLRCVDGAAPGFG
ncbi:unnamed protein product [Symbiodinium sp. CCMP2592]|nr:unnamed protein product [Symbiodinium sp. CCMP2592]